MGGGERMFVNEKVTMCDGTFQKEMVIISCREGFEAKRQTKLLYKCEEHLLPVTQNIRSH